MMIHTRIHVYIGGNAGLAAAYAAKALNLPITVYVPETIRELTKEQLIEQGAEVIVHGKVGV